MADAPFTSPEITDEDIRWASRRLGLPDDAFFGSNRDDPRVDVLKRQDTIDVEACPGSGKTTLLVAKLAMLARKWEHETRGICVLSHTNAARTEIENKLGGVNVGRRLLSYPHFVGTIHGFANEFLAMPCLRTLGHPVTAIDDDEVERRRRRLLSRQRFMALKTFVEKREKFKNVVGGWYVASRQFDVVDDGGSPIFKNAGKSQDQLTQLTKMVVGDGYHRYMEMLYWALEWLDERPGVAEMVSERFPVLLLDEAQDNSEVQSTILKRVFVDSAAAVIRQRFGDANQAIYNSVNDKGAATDPFPSNDPDVRVHVPSSHRFGTHVAAVAGPLALVPHDGGLLGLGPRPVFTGAPTGEVPATILLFDDNTVGHVLDEFGQILCDTFTDDELACGKFAAVGQVHRPSPGDQMPKSVGHYWNDYVPDLSGLAAKPKSFLECLRHAGAQAAFSGYSERAVEGLATAMLRLARMTSNVAELRARRRAHRHVCRLLQDTPQELESYTAIARRQAIGRLPGSERAWNKAWVPRIRKLAETIADSSLASSDDVDEFLAWPEDAAAVPSTGNDRAQFSNVYCYPRQSPKVSIKVGSVHSVKGQTHTATLVLETYWHDYNLRSLLSRIDGSKEAGGTEGVRQQTRLKVHYVAMTRPTHFLCLALHRMTFAKDNGELDPDLLEQVGGRGWQVVEVA